MEIGVNDILAILQRQLSSFWDVDLSGYLWIKEKITTAMKGSDIKITKPPGLAAEAATGSGGFSCLGVFF